MQGPDRALSTEARLLLALAHPRLSQEQIAVCRDVMEEEIDWGRFVDLCGRNKVLPLIGHHLSTLRLFHGRDGAMTVPYHYLYTSVYLANRVRNQALTEEFARVVDRIGAEGITYAVRKGPVVMDAVYPDPGARRMTDLDLLVHMDDKERLAHVLHGAGYRRGKVCDDGSVEPFSRRTQMFWSMNLHNELPYVRPTGREDVTAYTVDVCWDILPPREERGRHTAQILERAVSAGFCGIQGRKLAPDDHLVDLAVHLFKEATTLYYIENQADLQLQKFVDIAGSLPAVGDRESWLRLVRRTRELAVVPPVYFTLYYTDVLFRGSVPVDVLDALCPDDVGFLDEYGAPDGAPTRWDRPFLQRLLEAGGARGVTRRSAVPRT